ncbi:unnamed protein product [Gulo gulo]|uniref:Uncharacterized protein n=1 Tax=Gulo gulo TaxID=48420 RepID=A0A9X9M5F3_GULGU|nr:unnamed protein product [Gulo gulo]
MATLSQCKGQRTHSLEDPARDCKRDEKNFFLPYSTHSVFSVVSFGISLVMTGLLMEQQ